MTTDYDDSNIRVLEGLAAVRIRPGMYIGNTSATGLHHLVYEVVDNSIEEALAGHCKNIDISINANGSITVIDDGRGLEEERTPQTGEFSIEKIFTTLHTGKYRDCDRRIGGGLYGVGIAVVSALSSQVQAKVWRNQKIHTQHFERGIAVSALEIEPSEDNRTGNSITFLPDLEIFKDGIEFDFDRLAHRFRQLAFINAGVKINLIDAQREALKITEPKAENYYYPGGLRDYVVYLNADKQPLHEDIIYAETEKDRFRVEVALQWCLDDKDFILGFANTTQTTEGGMHFDGLKMAVTRTLNKIARQRNKLQPDDDNVAGNYIREGLTVIVLVLLPNPDWAGPTRTKLVNTKIREIVDSIVTEAMTAYFDAHPDIADAIITKAIKASEAAEIARKERELIRHRSNENKYHTS
jgi:DNA gyrase subunit B